MEIKNIEKFFLNTILKVSIIGVLVILVSDAVFFPEDIISITIDLMILTASLAAYLIRNRYSTVAVLILTSIVLLAMVYQCLKVPTNTTTSLSIILVIGFVISVMLNGKTMWIMHGITFIILQSIFIIQFRDPDLRPSPHAEDVLTIAITYTILYFILNYAAGVLKSSYDKIHQHLTETNLELQAKAHEIETQNKDLEKIVNERTAKIQIQNEILIKYSYTNAHHLRGPVARLLGLASVYKVEPGTDPEWIIGKMVDQAHEIDTVIKQINIDLAANNAEIKDKDASFEK